jgi:protein TonB
LRRLLFLLFSLCVHGTAAGMLFFFAGQESRVDEPVYRVQLAELALPEAPAPMPVEPPPEPQRPKPVTPVEPPQPPKKSVEPPKSKKISVHKKVDAPMPETPPAPVVPEAPVAPVPEQRGPQPQRFGGVAAYKADHVDQRPSIARRVSPEYPLKARRMEVEGEVMVQLVVDKAGQPQVCSVLAAVPAGYFEDAALEAAAKMRFIPGKIQGQPVNTMIVLPFTFRLR